jgi:Ca2+-binding EF-hand superfamily protein
MKLLSRSQVLFIALTCLAATASDADPNRRPKIDANGDGVVDFAEMQAVRPDLTLDEFNKLDTNSDGQVTPDELAAAFTAKMMKRLDTDGDGAVSLKEMEAFGPPHPGFSDRLSGASDQFADPAERFKQFDADGDGKLNKTEFTAMQESMRQQFETMRKHDRRPRPQIDSN